VKQRIGVLCALLGLVPGSALGQAAPANPAPASRPLPSPAATTPPGAAATTAPAPAPAPVATPAPPPTPKPIPAALPGDYVVNPGDQLEIYVWGEERLQRTLRVLPDGSFSFPLLGRIAAIGRTLPQIETMVSNGLQGQYRGQVPQVTVSVVQPAGLLFAVAGRVKSPGTFNPGRYVNLLEALTLAGGPDEFANVDNISIIRKTPTGLVTIRARLGGVFKGNLPLGAVPANQIPAIESGDTVIVP
jgi:polysaccharide biosynthesis/export protein